MANKVVQAVAVEAETQLGVGSSRAMANSTTAGGTGTDTGTSTRPTEMFEVDDSGTNATNTAEDETVYPKGLKLVAICSALAVVVMALGLDVAIVAVAVPALSDQFQTISDIAWYSTALRLVMCSLMFLAGKAYTLFSVRRLFLLSIVTFEVGNVLCTFAQTSGMFIAGRAICGFGCSGLFVGTFTIFNNTFPLRQRPMVGGIAGALEALACICAPLVGGALITGWTWRACFGINIPLGIFGCAIVFYLLDEKPNPDESLPLTEKIKRLDLLGTAFFVPSMVCLLLALQWGGSFYSWHSAQVIALLVLSVVLMVAFFLIEWKSGEKASLPFRILKNRSLLAGSFFALCCNATISSVEYYMSIYWQGVRGYTAVKSGIYALPMIVGMCIAAPMAGGFTTWIGYYFPTMYVCTILASVAVGVITTIDVDTAIVELLCMLALLGFAFGVGIQAPQIAAQTILDSKEVSIGISIVQFGSQIGPVLFIAAGTALFSNRLNVEIRNHTPPGTNVTGIQNMGLTDIRNEIGENALKGVLTGYNEALVQTLYLPLSLACVSIFGAVLIERRSVKKGRQ